MLPAALPSSPWPAEEDPRGAPLRVAEVALDLPRPAMGSRPWSAGFHYRLPSELAELARPGQAVWVPFGRRELSGLILDIGPSSPVERLRDVAAIIDPLPFLDRRDIDLARWMAEWTLAPLFDCLRLFLPPGGLPQVEEVYRRSGRRPHAEELRDLPPPAMQLLGLLQGHSEITAAALAAEGLRQPQLAAGPLLRAGLISQELRLSPLRLAPRKLALIEGPLTEASDLDALLAGLRPHPKADLLALLRQSRQLPLTIEVALDSCAAKRADLRVLEKAGLVAVTAASSRGEPARPSALTSGAGSPELLSAERRYRRTAGHVQALAALTALGGRVEERDLLRLPGVTAKVLGELRAWRLVDRLEAAAWRDPLVGQAIVQDEAWPLTPEQAAAWARLEPLLDQSLTGAAPPPILIRGVTGSGKTELYLRAIARVLAAGRQAVVLVPEIALTPQSLRRFAARFPGRVGVWHSRLSAGERADTWRRAREGLLDVIVGSRSAVLAPLPRLGLLVVDECHAGSYKQGQSPRYHAIDVARERAIRYGATLILGSATPTVEQTWEAEAGRMLGLTLANRVDQGAGEGLPPVRVIDMRAELKAGNTGLFSEALSDALAATLAAGEQAILFLNRRGSASYVFCRDCGESMRCPHCRVPLTWHQGAARLICHHCNHRAISPSMCPNCASGRIRHFGAGTERVEEAARRAHPSARILRWDADTTAHKGAHEAILATFVAGEADVLVGTQMIAKGLDLPRVTLVGIVSADTGLHFPDFRSAEQAFQLLTQVAGRAGRGEAGGQVILQTYQPEHPAILFAAAHDYPGFYRQELAFRRALGYPPFSRLTRLLYVTDGGPRAAEAAARKLAEQLTAAIRRLGLADTNLIGPAPAYFERMGGHTRWQILLRAPDPHTLLATCPPGPGWRVDVDAVDLL
ncbi:MAG: primosomal protein N' [Ardenticatenia bacterium]|nr:primosomal protein N' [Ardenticatenia bacterium]